MYHRLVQTLVPFRICLFLLYHSYLAHFCVYAAIVAIVLSLRNSLPTPVSRQDADALNGFSGVEAFNNLKAFSQSPHAFNAQVRIQQLDLEYTHVH